MWIRIAVIALWLMLLIGAATVLVLCKGVGESDYVVYKKDGR